MNKLFSVIVLCALLFSATSCSKDELPDGGSLGDNGEIIDNNEGHATAQIDGTSFNATHTYVSIGSSFVNSIINLVDDNSGYTIVISKAETPDPDNEGEFLMSYIMSCTLLVDGEEFGYYVSGSEGEANPTSELIITNETDTYIEGTFSFVGVYANPDDVTDTQEITVSDGEFWVHK